LADLPPLQRLRRFTADDLPCKICGGAARVLGGHDFNRSCEEVRGKFLPSAGLLVVYRRCGDCGFLFTDAFDDWSPEDFAQAIYNDGYSAVDPDYDTVRPQANAQMILKTFANLAGRLAALDYGGGNGVLAGELRKAGFTVAETYDPFTPAHSVRPERRYNLVTCFEAMEHMPDPVTGAADIASFLDDDGVIVFSTVTQPDVFDVVGMRWWYIGPRNGHISLHTRESLRRMWAKIGLTAFSLSASLHVAYRKPPSFVQFAGGT
jgi:2-polyprenyl-6-hydroxyphenyl methylase/3-demethylubiquinone-9 3-methyltransferase